MPNIIPMMDQSCIFLLQVKKKKIGQGLGKILYFDGLTNKYKQPLSAQCKVPHVTYPSQIKWTQQNTNWLWYGLFDLLIYKQTMPNTCKYFEMIDQWYTFYLQVKSCKLDENWRRYYI